VPAAPPPCTSAAARCNTLPLACAGAGARTATAALPGSTLEPVRPASAALPSALSWPAAHINLEPLPRFTLATDQLPPCSGRQCQFSVPAPLTTDDSDSGVCSAAPSAPATLAACAAAAARLPTLSLDEAVESVAAADCPDACVSSAGSAADPVCAAGHARDGQISRGLHAPTQ